MPDFEGARQLQITGRAHACFGAADDAEHTGGPGRWTEFEAESWRIALWSQPLRWRFIEASLFNP